MIAAAGTSAAVSDDHAGAGDARPRERDAAGERWPERRIGLGCSVISARAQDSSCCESRRVPRDARLARAICTALAACVHRAPRASRA